MIRVSSKSGSEDVEDETEEDVEKSCLVVDKVEDVGRKLLRPLFVILTEDVRTRRSIIDPIPSMNVFLYQEQVLVPPSESIIR